jgi:peptidoglycan DL-endopeptidase CwlO
MGPAPEAPDGRGPAPADASVANRPGDASEGAALVETALGFRGTPYTNGGSDPGTGFDCSGFTQYVFAQFGIALPREVAEQYRTGTPVALGQLQPGDLVFFHTVSAGASHVGIALGDDRFVHAPSSRGVVRVERLSSTYWSRRLVGVRRLVAAH